MISINGREYAVEKITDKYSPSRGLVRLTAFHFEGGEVLPFMVVDDLMEGSLTALKHHLGDKIYEQIVTELTSSEKSKSV